MWGFIWGYLFIFFARICDMSLDTIRVLCIVKGRKLLGSILGFFQVLIWLVVIKKVLSEVDSVGYMIAYAAGFAAGNYIGSVLEELIALGKVSVQVITSKYENIFAERIREAGFGVSSVECMGKYGQKTLLIIEIERKHLKKLFRLLNELDAEAFVSVFDINKTKNGFFGIGSKKRIYYRV